MSPLTSASPVSRTSARLVQTQRLCACQRPAVRYYVGSPCCAVCYAIEVDNNARAERRARMAEARVTVVQQEWLRIMADRWLQARERGQRLFSPRHPQASPTSTPEPHPGSRTTPFAAA